MQFNQIMMNKDDKQFIVGLIDNLRTEITGVEDRLGERITDVAKKSDEKIEGLGDRLNKKITSVENRLGEQIRHNGILIEELQDDVSIIAQNVETLNIDMTAVKGDINEVKTIIADYPILRETVKKHSKQLVKL